MDLGSKETFEVWFFPNNLSDTNRCIFNAKSLDDADAIIRDRKYTFFGDFEIVRETTTRQRIGLISCES
jgi:hypothetical protein